MKKVSIVIPAYNASAYLRECVVSALGQSYPEVEVIVVDDGSTDSTLGFARALEREDSRVLVIPSPNCGVVTAREKGVARASGEYLFFLDADDWLAQDAIRLLVARMEQTNADICLANYVLYRQDSKKEHRVSHRKRTMTPASCLAYCLHYGETFLPIKLYKTDLYRKTVKIPHDVALQEDTIGVMQYLESCTSVTFVEDAIYYYRKHGGTATSMLTDHKARGLFKVCEALSGCKFRGSIGHELEMARGRILQSIADECRNTELQTRARVHLSSLPAGILLELRLSSIKRWFKNTVKRMIAR